MAQACGEEQNFPVTLLVPMPGVNCPSGKVLGYQLKMFNHLPMLKRNLPGTLALKSFFYPLLPGGIYSGINSSGTFCIPEFISGIMPIFI